MQYASSFNLSNSANGPAVNQEDHPDDGHECDPAVPDWDDECSSVPGTEEYYGCPDPDPDGDGIVGEFDECPNDAAYPPNEVRGCPDSDGDGVPDKDDQCPGEIEDWMGVIDGCADASDMDGDGVPDDQDNCPSVTNPNQADFNNDGIGDMCSDIDQDGIYDDTDQCRTEKENFNNYQDTDGCPDTPPLVDTDNDGVPDEIDQCPNEYGTQSNGCPVPVDSDGDGVPDSSDACPNEYGTQSNGCPVPVDSDGDGIPDDVDSCPSQAENFNGYQDTDGCPDTPPVEPQNTPPVIISPTSITTDENTSVQFTINAVDTDGPLERLSFNPQSQPQHGTLTYAGVYTDKTADYIYTPSTNYNGPDSFSIMVWDGETNSAVTTIPITVNPAGAPPPTDSDNDGIPDDVDSCPSQAENYNNYQDTDGCPDTLPEGNIPPEIIVPTSITTNMNTPVTFRAIIIEPDGPQKEPSIYHIVQVKHGSFDVKILSGLDREYTYTPYKDYVGTDTFTLRVWDGKVNTDAPVTITIKAVDYSLDQDGDGINDDVDSCPSEPENFNQYLDDDGCPDSIPTETTVPEITVDKVPDFHEYFNYIVAGHLKSPNGLGIDRTELFVSLINTDTGKEVWHNYGEPRKVTTNPDGSYFTWVGGNSFVGPHKLTITFEGNFLYDKTEVSFPVEVKPFGPLPGCVQRTEYTITLPSGSVLCDDFHGTARLKPNGLSSPGTVQYGAEFQAFGKNIRYRNPDQMIISIYNPCDKLINEFEMNIAQNGNFWPKTTASGEGYQLSGTYKIAAHHKQSGTFIAETTFSVQSGGEFVSSPSDAQCGGTTTGGTITPPPTGESTGKISSPGTVQYGAEFQALGRADTYRNPDQMIISIYNPCDKLINEFEMNIAQNGNFWPKTTASGEGYLISGTYKLIAHHKQSGSYVAETTFSVQGGGPFVSSPSDSQCSGTGTSAGGKSWKGVLSGYGDFIVDGTDRLIYSIEGTFFFDIQDDGSLKGNGVSSMHISRSWGYDYDRYGIKNSCWTIDSEFDRKSAAYQIKGYYSNDKVSLYPSGGAPAKFPLTLWCSFQGYHQDIVYVLDPFTYGFNDSAVLDLKKGAVDSVTTNTPFKNTSGKIKWTFKITDEGYLNPKFTTAPPKVTPPPQPTPPPLQPTPPKITPTQPDLIPTTPPKTPPKTAPVPIPTAPKIPTLPPAPTTATMKKICEDLGLRYDLIVEKCVTLTPSTPVAPAPPTIPTPPAIPVTLSIDTDRTVYNQGNLVTIETQISGTTSNQNIAVSVIDSSSNVVLTRTITTDSSGTGSLPFKISHGTSSGTYEASATVSVDGETYRDLIRFTVKKDIAGISILSVEPTDQQGNPITSFGKEKQGYVKVKLDSDSFTTSLITVNIFDSDLTSLGTGSVKTTLSGQSELVLSFFIPHDAVMGSADIYVNIFTDWPSNGGTPLTRESSAKVIIG